MKSKFAILTLILTMIFTSGCAPEKELGVEDKIAVFETVNMYYYNLNMKNYKKSISSLLFSPEKNDSAGFELNNKALALSTIADSSGYSIRLAEIPTEIYYYLSDKDIYIVSVLIDIGFSGQTRRVEETLHLQKPVREWKICEIESSDPFIPLRANKYWYSSDSQE